MTSSANTTPSPAASERKTDRRADGSRPIVFFDGVCGMCNRTVDFLLVRDRREQFLFAPLQGETAQDFLSPRERAQLGSMVLQAGGKTYRASSAVARILWRLGGIWSLLGALLWLVPWPLRHLGYQFIAANRYRWFGKRETCRMPSPGHRERFLP